VLIGIIRRCAQIGTALALVLAGGCSRGPNELPAPLTIVVSSPGMVAGMLDRAHTCAGRGISPELTWSAPPAATRTLALVVTDLDARFGYDFVHWVLYDIPPSERELPAGFAAQPSPPGGIERGLNDDGHDGYVPPCPPGGAIHHYDFVIYALGTVVDTPGLSKAALFAAIRGHVLAKGELIARGER